MKIVKIDYERLLQEDISGSKLLHEFNKKKGTPRNIEEIAEINHKSRKFSLRNSEETEFQFVELSCVDSETGSITPKNVSRDKLSRKARFTAQKGDILFSLLASNEYKIAMVHKDGYIVSDNFMVISPKDNGEYIYAQLKNNYVRKQLEELEVKGSIRRITISKFKEINVLWKEEHKIKEETIKIKEIMEKFLNKTPIINSQKVDKVFYERFNVSKYIPNNEVKMVSYDKLFEESWDVKDILNIQDKTLEWANGHNVVVLSDICHIDKGVNAAKFRGGKPHEVLRAGNVKSFEISGKIKEQKFDCHKALESGYRPAEEDDILISIMGKVGQCAVVNEEYKGMLFNSTLGRISVKDESVSTEYLNAIMNSYIVQDQIKRMVKSTTAQFISLKQLNEIKVVVPDMETQREILREISK